VPSSISMKKHPATSRACFRCRASITAPHSRRCLPPHRATRRVQPPLQADYARSVPRALSSGVINCRDA
jgi:hypothetical protein